MTLKTVLNKVIVEPVEAETVTKGGIIIPDTAQEKPQKGTVIATGKGKADEPMEVKAGDTVLFGKYSGTEVHIDDKKGKRISHRRIAYQSHVHSRIWYVGYYVRRQSFGMYCGYCGSRYYGERSSRRQCGSRGDVAHRAVETVAGYQRGTRTRIDDRYRI